MSNLKHLQLHDLYYQKRVSTTRIKNLGSQLSGQKERLKWINHYIAKAGGETTDPELIQLTEKDKARHLVLLNKG